MSLEMKTLVIGSNEYEVVDEKARNNIQNMKRKFKPYLAYSVNWAGRSNGVDYVTSEDKRQTIINKMSERGIDGFILPLQTKFDSTTGTFSLINNLDKDYEYALISTNAGVPLHALKIHHSGYGVDEVLGNQTNFIANMKTIIDNVHTKFADLNVPYFTILNELTALFIDSNNDALVIELMDYVQSKGYSVGITSAGSNYFNRISDDILSKSDLLMVNEYVRIGSKRENTNELDSINSWLNADYNTWLNKYKGKYSDKKFIISETGCMNYWSALQAPSSWEFEETDFAENNKAQLIYYTGMFEQVKFVDEVWLWFELPDTSIFNKYIKGDEE